MPGPNGVPGCIPILLLRQQRILVSVTQTKARRKRHLQGESDTHARRNFFRHPREQLPGRLRAPELTLHPDLAKSRASKSSSLSSSGKSQDSFAPFEGRDSLPHLLTRTAVSFTRRGGRLCVGIHGRLPSEFAIGAGIARALSLFRSAGRKSVRPKTLVRRRRRCVVASWWALVTHSRSCVKSYCYYFS
jgi:hypothetical protein